MPVRVRAFIDALRDHCLSASAGSQLKLAARPKKSTERASK